MRTLIIRAAIALAAIFSGAIPAAARAQEPFKHALPSLRQAAWQDLELGMFIHFAPNTWSDSEGDDLSVPLSKINPELLNTQEWVLAAKLMGARYIVFVAKHVGGFCWWPTSTTDYSVKSIPWRGGKGDVLRDLAESCKKMDMKLGVHISPADRKHGAGAGGKCNDSAAQADYIKIYRSQLTEVLSNYGDMCEVWFDGGLVFDVGDILKQYAPNAVVFQGPNPDIRWVGNEDGVAPHTAWNSVDITKAPAQFGVYTAADGNSDGNRWMPIECDARMRDTWFWNSKNAKSLKSVDALVTMYNNTVGRGTVLLLNQTPDTTGRIPDLDMKRGAHFGAEIARRYGSPLATASGNGATIQLNLGSPTMVDAVSMAEKIEDGERVREYFVEALVRDQWKTVARGMSVGHRRIDTFEEVYTSQLRLRIPNASAEPHIRTFSAFRTRATDSAQTVLRLKAPSLQIMSPLDYQVFQRRTPSQGVIRVAGTTTHNADTIDARLLQLSSAASGGYITIAVDPVTRGFYGELESPAGGWYQMEVRARSGETVLEKLVIPHVGVGEVFLGAGQSNSTNSGGEGLLKLQSEYVSTFSGFDWRLANDPQPGVHDSSTGGSFWPAFGDLMYDRYHVPIGLAVTGHGGTSIRQWQVGGELFHWFMTRTLQFGPSGFRAVLWHQGESDVDMLSEQYALGLAQIIRDSRRMAGWNIPWFVARVSYHSPDHPLFDTTRNAQKMLWDAGVAFEGPDSDQLGGDNRDGLGRGIHFSSKGLREHGRLWAEKISVYLDKILQSGR